MLTLIRPIFCALALLANAAAPAQNYPARPLRLVVPTGAGGVTDILARYIAPRLSASLGQQVEAGDCLMIIESMKMEIPVEAPCAGVVSALHRSKGDMVSEGDVVALIVASGG